MSHTVPLLILWVYNTVCVIVKSHFWAGNGHPLVNGRPNDMCINLDCSVDCIFLQGLTTGTDRLRQKRIVRYLWYWLLPTPAKRLNPLTTSTTHNFQFLQPSQKLFFLQILYVVSWLVVSTHLKNMFASQIGEIFPKVRGENKKSLSCHHLSFPCIIPYLDAPGS